MLLLLSLLLTSSQPHISPGKSTQVYHGRSSNWDNNVNKIQTANGRRVRRYRTKDKIPMTRPHGQCSLSEDGEHVRIHHAETGPAMCTMSYPGSRLRKTQITEPITKIITCPQTSPYHQKGVQSDGQNYVASCTVKGGKKTRRTKEEVGRHQGMDRSGVRQVPDGSREQGKMEKTSCKIICGDPTTLAVKGLTMMMMTVR